jgi:hypothetical protein
LLLSVCFLLLAVCFLLPEEIEHIHKKTLLSHCVFTDFRELEAPKSIKNPSYVLQDVPKRRPRCHKNAALCFLFAACCLLLAAFCFRLAAFCYLLAVYCLLLVSCCLLRAACCLL